VTKHQTGWLNSADLQTFLSLRPTETGAYSGNVRWQAYTLAKLGGHVFPCIDNVWRNGALENAANEPEKIRIMFEQNPVSDYRIRCGRQFGFWGLKITRDRDLTYIEKETGRLTPSLISTHKNGKATWFWYKALPTDPPLQFGRLFGTCGELVQTLAVPGSINRASNQAYEWIRGRGPGSDFAPLPKGALQVLPKIAGLPIAGITSSTTPREEFDARKTRHWVSDDEFGDLAA